MNNFPAMTEEQRQELIKRFTLEISRLNNKRDAAQSEDRYFSGGDLWALQAFEIALAALTADTSKLAELAAKVRKVREDAADFDGDRRGMWEYQEEQEQLLLEEAVKYTAPPAPVLRLPGEVSCEGLDPQEADEARNLGQCEGWNACLAEVKRLNSQPAPTEASNEQ